MNVKSMFPSKFVAAQDLCGQAVNVVMASIKVEKVGSDDEQRPVLYFQGMTKGMVPARRCPASGSSPSRRRSYRRRQRL
jgi:hypothetical protein